MSTTTNRIRRLIRRHWLLLAVSAVALAAIAALVVLLVQPPAEPVRPALAGADPVLLDVQVETNSGLIGRNHDDRLCVFPELAWQLADASGTLVATGRWEDDRASVGDAQWAGLGHVVTTDPYLCRHTGRVKAPALGIYTLTVSAGGTATEVVIGEGERSVTVVLD